MAAGTGGAMGGLSLLVTRGSPAGRVWAEQLGVDTFCARVECVAAAFNVPEDVVARVLCAYCEEHVTLLDLAVLPNGGLSLVRNALHDAAGVAAQAWSRRQPASPPSSPKSRHTAHAKYPAVEYSNAVLLDTHANAAHHLVDLCRIWRSKAAAARSSDPRSVSLLASQLLQAGDDLRETLNALSPMGRGGTRAFSADALVSDSEYTFVYVGEYDTDDWRGRPRGRVVSPRRWREASIRRSTSRSQSQGSPRLKSTVGGGGGGGLVSFPSASVDGIHSAYTASPRRGLHPSDAVSSDAASNMVGAPAAGVVYVPLPACRPLRRCVREVLPLRIVVPQLLMATGGGGGSGPGTTPQTRRRGSTSGRESMSEPPTHASPLSLPSSFRPGASSQPPALVAKSGAVGGGDDHGRGMRQTSDSPSPLGSGGDFRRSESAPDEFPPTLVSTALQPQEGKGAQVYPQGHTHTQRRSLAGNDACSGVQLLPRSQRTDGPCVEVPPWREHRQPPSMTSCGGDAPTEVAMDITTQQYIVDANPPPPVPEPDRMVDVHVRPSLPPLQPHSQQLVQPPFAEAPLGDSRSDSSEVRPANDVTLVAVTHTVIMPRAGAGEGGDADAPNMRSLPSASGSRPVGPPLLALDSASASVATPQASPPPALPLHSASQQICNPADAGMGGGHGYRSRTAPTTPTLMGRSQMMAMPAGTDATVEGGTSISPQSPQGGGVGARGAGSSAPAAGGVLPVMLGGSPLPCVSPCLSDAPASPPARSPLPQPTLTAGEAVVPSQHQRGASPMGDVYMPSPLRPVVLAPSPAAPRAASTLPPDDLYPPAYAAATSPQLHAQHRPSYHDDDRYHDRGGGEVARASPQQYYVDAAGVAAGSPHRYIVDAGVQGAVQHSPATAFGVGGVHGVHRDHSSRSVACWQHQSVAFGHHPSVGGRIGGPSFVVDTGMADDASVHLSPLRRSLQQRRQRVVDGGTAAAAVAGIRSDVSRGSPTRGGVQDEVVVHVVHHEAGVAGAVAPPFVSSAAMARRRVPAPAVSPASSRTTPLAGRRAAVADPHGGRMAVLEEQVADMVRAGTSLFHEIRQASTTVTHAHDAHATRDAGAHGVWAGRGDALGVRDGHASVSSSSVHHHDHQRRLQQRHAVPAPQHPAVVGGGTRWAPGYSDAGAGYVSERYATAHVPAANQRLGVYAGNGGTGVPRSTPSPVLQQQYPAVKRHISLATRLSPPAATAGADPGVWRGDGDGGELLAATAGSTEVTPLAPPLAFSEAARGQRGPASQAWGGAMPGESAVDAPTGRGGSGRGNALHRSRRTLSGMEPTPGVAPPDADFAAADTSGGMWDREPSPARLDPASAPLGLAAPAPSPAAPPPLQSHTSMLQVFSASMPSPARRGRSDNGNAAGRHRGMSNADADADSDAAGTEDEEWEEYELEETDEDVTEDTGAATAQPLPRRRAGGGGAVLHDAAGDGAFQPLRRGGGASPRAFATGAAAAHPAGRGILKQSPTGSPAATPQGSALPSKAEGARPPPLGTPKTLSPLPRTLAPPSVSHDPAAQASAMGSPTYERYERDWRGRPRPPFFRSPRAADRGIRRYVSSPMPGEPLPSVSMQQRQAVNGAATTPPRSQPPAPQQPISTRKSVQVAAPGEPGGGGGLRNRAASRPQPLNNVSDPPAPASGTRKHAGPWWASTWNDDASIKTPSPPPTPKLAPGAGF